jgi:hypothetical protein
MTPCSVLNPADFYRSCTFTGFSSAHKGTYLRRDGVAYRVYVVMIGENTHSGNYLIMPYLTTKTA